MVEEARLESVYTSKAYRGFESPSLRKKECKSSICEIYTLFHTPKSKVGCFYIHVENFKCDMRQARETPSTYGGIHSQTG